jgi:hypothetical protein
VLLSDHENHENDEKQKSVPNEHLHGKGGRVAGTPPSSPKPMGYTRSYLACIIQHLLPILQGGQHLHDNFLEFWANKGYGH